MLALYTVAVKLQSGDNIIYTMAATLATVYAIAAEAVGEVQQHIYWQLDFIFVPCSN